MFTIFRNKSDNDNILERKDEEELEEEAVDDIRDDKGDELWLQSIDIWLLLRLTLSPTLKYLLK